MTQQAAGNPGSAAHGRAVGADLVLVFGFHRNNRRMDHIIGRLA
jgi:hypothetical protein